MKCLSHLFTMLTWAQAGALISGLATVVAAAPSTDAVQAPEFHRAEADRAFAARLTDLAEEAEAAGLTQLSHQIRDWVIPRYADRQYLFLPPSIASTAKGELAKSETELRSKWMEARGEQAGRLADLADREIVDGNAEAAVQLLYEVLRERPDDKKARQALGLRKVTGTAGGQKGPSVSRTAHHALGWPASGYWRMQTEHFLLTTNHSVEAANDLALVLEEFHSVWKQLFVGYWTTPAAVRQSIAGRGLPRNGGKRHKVVLFKSQQEYVDHLKRVEPQAAMTLGIYRDQERTAYFFVGEKDLRSTWRHEVAHQLFYESLRRGQRIGTEQNFWFVEGIALYLESLRRIETCGSDAEGAPCDSAYYTVGGFDAERLQFARYRALNEGFYVPSDELSQLGRVALQQDSRIRRLYSQSAGLAHFLLDGEQARYRKAALELLREIYNNRDKPESLFELTDTTPTELDAAYRRFLVVQDEQLAALNDAALLSKLCLGNSSVTDAGLEQLGSLRQLTWLDLAHCNISDVGVRYLSPELPLTRLNLEGTEITDAALDHIGHWSTLTELDLSETPITDASLVEVAKLKNLRVLWLTGTEVTDAGLRQLTGLKHLESLDISHTKVTPQAWERLQKDLPQLNTAAQN